MSSNCVCFEKKTYWRQISQNCFQFFGCIELLVGIHFQSMLCYAAMYFLYEINCLFIDLNVISNSRHTNKNIFRNPIKGFLRIEIIQELIYLLYSSSLWVFSSIHMDRSFDGARGAFWTNHLKIYLLKLGVTVYISIRFSVIA